MAGLQEWFTPLLWVLGTITALVAFVRLCKPIWSLFQCPKETSKQIVELMNKVDEHFSATNKRLDRFDEDLAQLKEHDANDNEVQKKILADRLSQGHHFFAEAGSIPDESYKSFCGLYESYKKLKGNSYIDTVMEQIEFLYKNPKDKK